MSLCFYSHRFVPNISYTIPSFVFMLILLITDQKMKEKKKKRKSCFCVWVFSVALNHTFFHKYFVSLYFKRLLGRKHQLSNWSRSRIMFTIFRKKKNNKSQGKLVLVVCLRCKFKKMEKKTYKTKQHSN